MVCDYYAKIEVCHRRCGMGKESLFSSSCHTIAFLVSLNIFTVFFIKFFFFNVDNLKSIF